MNNDWQKNFAFALVFTLRSACMTKHKEISINALMHYLNEKQYVDTCDFNAHNRNFDFDPANFTGIDNEALYFLNASCSICIAQFFKFIDITKKNNCKCRITVLIDENKAAMIEYYLSLLDKDLQDRIYLVENKQQKFLNTRIENEDLNGIIFLIKLSEIEACYRFEPF